MFIHQISTTRPPHLILFQAALIACQNEEIRTIEYLLTIRRQSGMAEKRPRNSPPVSNPVTSTTPTTQENIIPPTTTSLQLPPISLKVRLLISSIIIPALIDAFHLARVYVCILLCL